MKEKRTIDYGFDDFEQISKEAAIGYACYAAQLAGFGYKKTEKLYDCMLEVIEKYNPDEAEFPSAVMWCKKTK